MLLSPGPVWHHREAYTIRPGAGGEVCEVCEGEDGDRTELRQAAEAGLHDYHYYWNCFFLLSESKSSPPRPAPCCVQLFLKFLYRPMISWGQNLTCLWRTHSCCVLAAACCPSPLHPWWLPGCSPTSGWSAELSWRGEEVGADWHMADRMWSEGVWKEEEHFSVRTDHFYFSVYYTLNIYECNHSLSLSPAIINSSLLLTGTFLRSITQNGAAKMSQSAGEWLWVVYMLSFFPYIFFESRFWLIEL